MLGSQLVRIVLSSESILPSMLTTLKKVLVYSKSDISLFIALQESNNDIMLCVRPFDMLMPVFQLRVTSAS